MGSLKSPAYQIKHLKHMVTYGNNLLMMNFKKQNKTNRQNSPKNPKHNQTNRKASLSLKLHKSADMQFQGKHG